MSKIIAHSPRTLQGPFLAHTRSALSLPVCESYLEVHGISTWSHSDHVVFGKCASWRLESEEDHPPVSPSKLKTLRLPDVWCIPSR